MVKHLPAMQETQVWSLGQEDPLEKEMAIHSSILPGESHGQRSLVGYSPWGHKESDTTERLTHTHPIYITYILIYGNRKILHFTIICTWRGMIHFSSVNWDFLEHDTLHHFHRQRFRERNFITESDSLSFLTISGKLLCIHTYIHTYTPLAHPSLFFHSFSPNQALITPSKDEFHGFPASSSSTIESNIQAAARRYFFFNI